MDPTETLQHASVSELFAELVDRHQFQAAFALFSRAANDVANELDLYLAGERRPAGKLKLKHGHQQLAAMWQVHHNQHFELPALALEDELFRNLMESHVVELAARSDLHRDFFAILTGGPQKLDSLQYVRSESAARWMIGQLCQVETA